MHLQNLALGKAGKDTHEYSPRSKVYPPELEMLVDGGTNKERKKMGESMIQGVIKSLSGTALRAWGSSSRGVGKERKRREGEDKNTGIMVHRESRKRGRDKKRDQQVLPDIMDVMQYHVDQQLVGRLKLNIESRPDMPGFESLTPLQQAIISAVAPIQIGWDIEEYLNASDTKRLRMFPVPKIGNVQKPATFVDSQGRYVAWYFPGLLGDKQLKKINEATQGLDCMLAQSVKPKKTEQASSSWRNEIQNFVAGTTAGGSLNFSSGWFAPGHSSSRYLIKPSLNTAEPAANKWLKKLTPPHKDRGGDGGHSGAMSCVQQNAVAL
ncbi:hypothetical protein R3P38DRAFT_2804547 [Favolaschia claudopus]|uniref:Uncharacterized protein n=1 Tax=Favolaschia claudopus TaxID=2862362 RepID=A0AAV9ZQ11_9AGAR